MGQDISHRCTPLSIFTDSKRIYAIIGLEIVLVSCIKSENRFLWIRNMQNRLCDYELTEFAFSRKCDERIDILFLMSHYK